MKIACFSQANAWLDSIDSIGSIDTIDCISCGMMQRVVRGKFSVKRACLQALAGAGVQGAAGARHLALAGP